MPDRQAHHDPAEQAHQRVLPWRRARGRFWRGFGLSLSTRSSGVRSAAGSRWASGLGRPGRRRAWRRPVVLVAGARPRPARAASLARVCPSAPRRRGRDQLLELVAGDLLARLLGRDHAAAPRAPALAARARRRRARRPRSSRRRARVPVRARCRARRCAVAGLALLPVREHRRGDEDRGVGPRGDPDHQREREVLQRFTAEQQQREHRQQRAEARGQRPREHLGHRAVDDLRERGAGHARHVLAHAVEHDDRVVQRVSEDRQQRGHRRRRDFPPGERVHASGDQQVVHQRDQHRHGVLPLEAQRDVGGDHQQRGDDRDHRALGDRLAERRPDRGRGEVPRPGELRQPNFVSRCLRPLDASGASVLVEIWIAVAADALARELLDLRRSGSPRPTSAERPRLSVTCLLERRLDAGAAT